MMEAQLLGGPALFRTGTRPATAEMTRFIGTHRERFGGEPPEGPFASVSSGSQHTCGVRTDGSVACWGLGLDGQSSPPGGTFISVSSGFLHTCGVRAVRTATISRASILDLRDRVDSLR